MPTESPIGQVEYQISPDYIPWHDRPSPYLKDHEFLSNLSTQDYFSLLEDPDRCLGLIQGALLEEEYALFNDGKQPLKETKIIFMIADNLKTATNLDGTKARQKDTRYAKASEHDELIAILSQFIEHYPGTPAHKVYSEMADVFWNLTQLAVTDQDFHFGYEKLLTQTVEASGLTLGQAGLLVITKYATRLYRHHGGTNHFIEDAQIEQLLYGVFDEHNQQIKILPVLNEEQASCIYDVMQKIVKPILSSRFEQMLADSKFTDLLAQYLPYLTAERET